MGRTGKEEVAKTVNAKKQRIDRHGRRLSLWILLLILAIGAGGVLQWGCISARAKTRYYVKHKKKSPYGNKKCLCPDLSKKGR